MTLYWALGVVLVDKAAPCWRIWRDASISRRGPGYRSGVSDVPAEALRAAPTTAARRLAGGELMLVDGNSLAYRAFFALPDTISTADGFPTNALYGLAAMMMKVVHRGAARPGGGVLGRPRQDVPARGVPRVQGRPGATPDLFREQSRALPAR